MLRQPIARSLSLIVATSLVSCLSAGPRARREKLHEQMEGSRTVESPERRTAENRPLPWEQDQRPLDADRTGGAAYRAQRRAQADRRARGGVTHGRCLQLQQRYACPLLAHRWTVRDVEGGVELSTRATPEQAALLREALYCHDAVGRHDPHEEGCLQQFVPARISGGFADGVMTLKLLTPDRAGVAPLRRRVRALVEEAL